MKTERTRPQILVLGSTKIPIERAGGRAVNYFGYGSEGGVTKALEKGAISGLLLTGGGDVDPLLYADAKHPRVYGVDYDRDEMEWDALVAADEADIPVLGICRGAQMMNVTFGGTLNQNIADLTQTHAHHLGGDHRVRAAAGSRLAAAWGDTDEDQTRWVVSIHHQAVEEVADGFVATGWGLDGTIETIEAIEGWSVGVQFHPEMDYQAPHHQRLFDRFVGAAAKHAGMEWTLPSRPDREKVVRVPEATPYSIEKDNVWRKRSSRTSTWDAPVLSRWRCFRCGMDFDERQDHTDHMTFLHQVEAQ